MHSNERFISSLTPSNTNCCPHNIMFMHIKIINLFPINLNKIDQFVIDRNWCDFVVLQFNESFNWHLRIYLTNIFSSMELQICTAATMSEKKSQRRNEKRKWDFKDVTQKFTNKRPCKDHTHISVFLLVGEWHALNWQKCGKFNWD